MISSKKSAPLNKPQHKQMEYAQRRINQKKRLYYHFVLFLVGSVFLVLLNKVFKYGAEYNWFKWAILFWAFLFAIHLFNVYVTHQFMGRDWERKQREK
ncbi:MAG: 2TM domain-containing protein, partial [Flavobacteriaceae bacterium]|nr:2TM domain-containing protein [Flavobacteriaceae bacterium]